MNKFAFYEFKRRAVSVLFPNVCPFCGRVIEAADYYCEACFELLPVIRAAQTPPSNISRMYACCWYTGIARKAVHLLKFGEYIYSADAFGLFMTEMLNEANVSVDALVPAPSSLISIERRGFSPASAIAQRISLRTGFPVEEALTADIDKIDQKTLTRKSRIINAKKCFHLSKYAEVSGKRLLLIDDVTTTGSTLSALAEILLNAGAAEVSAAVFAKVPGDFKKTDSSKFYRKTKR